MQSNKMTRWPLCLAGLVCAHEPALAQTTPPLTTAIRTAAFPAAPAVTVPDSHVHKFKSAINGNDYELFVFLPSDYDTTTKKYPVLYLLDGNAWQAAYAAIQRITLGGDMPHIILVGVGYQGATMRSSDYPTPKGAATSEIDRYCVSPGQACSYMIGKQTLLGLRESTRARLGARFDIRDFHDRILAGGSVPLTLLPRVVEGYR